MRVGIVGGSVGGLATAWALRERGFEPVIFERSRGQLSHRGAGVMLDPQVCPRLGLISRSVERRLLLDPDGKVLWEHPVQKRAVRWGHLYRRLRDLAQGVELHDGCEVHEVRDDPPGLAGQDGRWHEFDLVVGADGIGSRVRQSLDPEFRAEYLGYMAIRGLVRRSALPGSLPPPFEALFEDAMGQVLLAGEHITVYGLQGDPEPSLNWMWYRNTTPEEMVGFLTDQQGVRHEWSMPPGGLGPEAERALRSEVTRRLPGWMSELVAATEILFLQPVFSGMAERTHQDRTILVGDAAHLAVPHAGAGFSLALGDALGLAEALAAVGDPLTGLGNWAKERRQDARTHLEMAVRLGRYLQTPGRDWSGWTPNRFERWWKEEILAGQHPYFER